MKKRSLFYVPVLLLTGILSVNAENTVPITSLTKSCQPLINKDLKIPKVPFRGLSERSHRRISRALEKLAEENYVEAIDLFKKLFESSKDRNVRSQVAKYIGIAYAQQNNTKDATVYFEKALDLGKGYLQHKELQDLTQNVAAMHYSNDNKPQSLKFLERWLKNSNVDNHQVFLLYAAILFDSGRLKDSVCPAYWAAKVAKKPSKSAFGIMLNVHFEFKEYKGTIAILKQLILDFPKEKRFWRNLASVYSSQDMIDDALVVMEMFYVQGLMETENDYKLLSSMFAYRDIPYRTAAILKEGLDIGLVKDTGKNWKNVASNFHIANELDRAIEAYGKSAAKTESGENDLKQAELLADTGKYKRAIQVFDKALSKGGLKEPGGALLRKGLAYYELKQYNRAIATLGKATKYKKWRKRAVQWTGYVKNQKRNAAKL